jgi:hypothetical protein
MSTPYSLGRKRFTPASTAASTIAFCCPVEEVAMAETMASLPLNAARREEWE